MIEDNSNIKQSNFRTLSKLCLLVVGMFAFGFVLVPLYDVICDITGIDGRTGQITENQIEEPDLSREITVKFISSLNNFAPWEFAPNEITMKVNPGAVYSTSYTAKNMLNKNLIGQAVPSVVPKEASLYFNKTECFCFSKQHFKPNETREMPVRFVVDRDIPAHLETIILSYTFFDISEQS